MYRPIVIFFTVCATLLIPETDVRIPAFPGAEGFGAGSMGGRGGKVLFVSNLNDGGPGSLRAAVETQGPRTIHCRFHPVAILSSIIVRRTGPWMKRCQLHQAAGSATSPSSGVLFPKACTIRFIIRALTATPRSYVEASATDIPIIIISTPIIMPDDWEKRHDLNPGDLADGNNEDKDADGYTNLEVYLNNTEPEVLDECVWHMDIQSPQIRYKNSRIWNQYVKLRVYYSNNTVVKI